MLKIFDVGKLKFKSAFDSIPYLQDFLKGQDMNLPMIFLYSRLPTEIQKLYNLTN